MKERVAQRIRQRDAASLAQGYGRGIRRVEIASIAVYFVLMLVLAYRLAPAVVHSPWLVMTAVLLGYLAADFVSGFVHWMADSWGSVDMPVIGKALLRPFREHHVDPEAITRHDFVETNGNNCLISLPPAIICLFVPVGAANTGGIFFVAFVASLILWVLFTNQFHKWSHMRKPAPVVAFLQRMHLILPPAHHAIHHRAPFAKYYCITVGWMNWPLTVTRFFPILERIVTATTGLLPRQDDIGELAARMLEEQRQREAPKLASAPQTSETH